MANNPAALQGWVKSQDPNTGRVFYANHVTRRTQWEAPPGWSEEPELPPPPLPSQEICNSNEDDDILPSNWEVLHDPSTGRPFYVDHVRKITTWTRPTSATSGGGKSAAPTTSVSTSNSRSNAFQRLIASSSSPPATTASRPAARSPPSARAAYAPSASSRSYQQESSFYQSHTSNDDDFSDTMPSLDFRVQKVADANRLECPHCDTVFTLSKRRHHCRLCGDIFCDTCSNHRVSLPLEGPEFDAPVRVCDLCHQDVEKGNFFSMRRYLTPLQLYEPSKDNEDDTVGVATASNVAAALSALTTDLDSLLHNSSSFAEKVTIPPDVLVPAITKHLALRKTSDRAMRALASLLSLGSIVMKQDFVHAVYLYGGKRTLDDILALLERSGSDRKTLFVQEQAARALFYLTDPSILTSLTAKQNRMQAKDKESDYGGVESLDMERTLRNMLDHSSMSKNPALQRWAAASIRNLVMEDQRRTCMAANDVAAALASGQEYSTSLGYQSFLDQLISTGGIMILCSLIGADDPDTRAHTTDALRAILTATRAIDASLEALREMTGQGSATAKDGDIIRAIVSAGGCGSSLSQLLLSADNAVAVMGCQFIASLVMPLLEDPRGSTTLPSNYDCQQDNDGIGACREAALAVATGSCLPALLSLVKDPGLGGRTARPMELRKSAMEILSAVVMSIGNMARANENAHGIREGLAMLNEEDVVTVALEILESSASQSLVSSRDTPAMRIRECAGMVLSSMTLCSSDAVDKLRSRHAITSLLAVSSDQDMSLPSTLRGDGAPRCLGMIEAAATMITFFWKEHDSTPSQLLDQLLEAIDAGAISTVSRILFAKMDWESHQTSVGGMKAREACCRMLAAMFGIAGNDDTGIGETRLFAVVDADAYARNPPRNVVTATLSILQSSSNYARRALMGGGNQGPHYHAAVVDLVEAALLAAGSMCGSLMPPGDTDVAKNGMVQSRSDDVKKRVQEACGVACDVLVHRGRMGPLLPTMLVGGFGEASVNASLRLVLAIAQNGSTEHHAKLAMSGILVPISDSLRNALSGGDLYRFSASLSLVRFCGPHIAAGEAGGLQSVREAIRVATNVLTLPVSPTAGDDQLDMEEHLKSECISTLEALSKNAGLWSSISKDALPSIVTYLFSSCETGVESACRRETRCAALRAIVQIVQIPSHAVSAAQAGVAEPLAMLLRQGERKKQTSADADSEMPLLALEILHVIASNDEARKHSDLLACGVFQAVCTALGNATATTAEKSSESRADVTFWGLEILHYILNDIQKNADTHMLLQSPVTNEIVDMVARESLFINALCSTMLVQTRMKLPLSESDGEDTQAIDIPVLYGSPLILVQERCAGYADTHIAAMFLLFSISVFACAVDTPSSESLWNTLLLRSDNKNLDETACVNLAATWCAHFLSLLGDDAAGSLVPTTERKRQDFRRISRPLLRHRLLEGLKSCLEEQCSTPNVMETDRYMAAMLIGYQVPRLCQQVCEDPTLIDFAFALLKLMVESFEDDVLPLFVQSKRSMLSLFEMLNMDITDHSVVVQTDEVRRFVASILGTLAQSGLLARSVERLGVRSSAISALATACLSEDEMPHEDDGDMPAMESRMSSRCMQCLVELCTFEGEGPIASTSMRLSPVEAETIAKTLGKKICQMIISRFLERAKLEQYSVDSGDDIIREAPDVLMLCAVAQHDEALKVIKSIGGLHALSLIASEGELAAIVALQKACGDDPSQLIEVDGHKSIMALFGDDTKISRQATSSSSLRQIESTALQILAQICRVPMGRSAVTSSAELCSACTGHAAFVISSMASPLEMDTNSEHSAVSFDGDSTLPKVEPSQTESRGELAVISIPADTCMERSAFAFLTALVPVETCRSVLLIDRPFLETAFLLAKMPSASDLQLEAVKFLVKIAPYAKTSSEDNDISTAKLAEVFRDAVDTSSMTKNGSIAPLGTSPHSGDCLRSIAVEGLHILFENIDSDLQASVMIVILRLFGGLVRSCAVTPSPKADYSNAGLLLCSLSSLMLLARGKEPIKALLSSTDVFISMIHLTQWRYDPKSRPEGRDSIHLDASVCNCLQIMAFIFGGTLESCAKSGIVVSDLARTVLMMSRQGKAPRKACDFPSALRRIVDEGKDSASVFAARRILDLLVE